MKQEHESWREKEKDNIKYCWTFFHYSFLTNYEKGGWKRVSEVEW